MKALVDSMLSYWILLLVISLGMAALVYIFWLREAMLT